MITELSPERFDEVYAIFEESFPIDEYRPPEEQRALMEHPCYKVYVQKVENDKIASFFSVWKFEKFSYIEHFAVKPEYRNGGRGAKFLQDMIAQLDKPVVLEVEPPLDEMSVRRIGFYERNGFAYNDYPYFQPPISKGRNRIDLMIMSLPSAVSPVEYEEMKRTIHTVAYKYFGD